MRYGRWLSYVTVLLWTAAANGAAPAARTGSAKVCGEPELLSHIPERLRSHVDAGEIAGAVTLVERHGAIASLEAVGYQDLESKKPMRADTIFEIMSMTKPLTSVAAMMLLEEGRLTLLDPVSKYLPEFDAMKSMRPITIRDLMTHTSGMPENPPADWNLYAKMDRTLAEVVHAYAGVPLLFEPGTSWQYSNTGMATLGRIVEVVSGMPYERFLEERIFKPLGMSDTFIFPPVNRYSRIASVYTFKDGKLQSLGEGIYRKGAKYSMPEGGVYSTAADMAQFYRMMLNGGTLNGRRLISKATVETMTTVHTGNLKVWGSEATGYGLGWSVTRTPAGTLTLNQLGSYGHGGAFGTNGWLDPARDLIEVFMVQQFPAKVDTIRNEFQAIAAAACSQ